MDFTEGPNLEEERPTMIRCQDSIDAPARLSLAQYLAGLALALVVIALMLLALPLAGCQADPVGPQIRDTADGLSVINSTANTYKWVDAIEEPLVTTDGKAVLDAEGNVVTRTVKPGSWTAVTAGPVTGVQQPGQTVFKASQVTRDMTVQHAGTTFLLSSGDGVEVEDAGVDPETGKFGVGKLKFDSAASIAALEPLQKQITAGVALTAPAQVEAIRSVTERYIETVKAASPVLGQALQALLASAGVPGA